MLTKNELIRMRDAILDIKDAFDLDKQEPTQATKLLENLINRELDTFKYEVDK